MNALPDKPSELIRLALDDLRKVESDREYAVMMGTWHSPEVHSWKSICFVCFAGAVMAQTLDTPKNVRIAPSQWNDDTANKLRALNCFRIGCVQNGLEYMGLAGAKYFPSVVYIPQYSAAHKEAFHTALHELADSLEGQGL